MPEDQRPVTLSDLREFRNDLRDEIKTLQSRVETLSTGQASLALQFERSLRDESDKRNTLQQDILKARSQEEKKTEGLSVKMGIVWAAGGAILLAIVGILANILKNKQP